MADGLGSRIMIESPHWKAMQSAGVQVATALPIGNPLLRPLRGRIDLRNHRKILVVDNRITYCGSQNCADPEFRIKAKFAPWVDAVMRFEGPIARQNQYLFASDWMAQTDDDLTPLLRQPLPSGDPGLTAQVIGTGPTVYNSAMPEVFETLIVHRPPGAGDHDSLLCARRSHADCPLCQCTARRDYHYYFPRAKRLMVRERSQSQLLQ